MYALYVAFSVDPELPHLLPASIFRALSFSFLFTTVFSNWFLHVSFLFRYIPE